VSESKRPTPLEHGMAYAVSKGSVTFPQAVEVLVRDHLLEAKITPPTAADYASVMVWQEKGAKPAHWEPSRDLDGEYERRVLDIEQRVSMRLDILVERVDRLIAAETRDRTAMQRQREAPPQSRSMERAR
jgi:hypothetical protein